MIRERAALLLHEAYVRLFECKDGQSVLMDLRERGFIDSSTMRAGEDAQRIAFNEGRRSLVLHIHTMLDPKKFEKIKETLNQVKENTNV